VGRAPRYAKAHLNLGAALEALGDTAGAVACYEQARAMEPGNPAGSYNLGKLLYARGALTEAEQLLKEALERRPDFPEARLVLGYALEGLGRLEPAAAQLRAGLAQRPEDPTARAALSRVLTALMLESGIEHHQAGRAADAEAAYRAVLAREPRNVDALHFLGFLAHEQGLYEQAADFISRSLQIQPANAQARCNLGRVRQAQGHVDEALACYRETLGLAPGHVDALFGLGQLLAARGELEQALRAYQELIERAPDHAAAHYNLAIAQREQGRGEEAMLSFRRALELRPETAQAHYGLGHLLRDAGRIEQALDCFRQALALDADYVEARWSIAMTQLPAVYAAGDDPRACRSRFAAELASLESWFDEKRAQQGSVAVGSAQPFALAYQEEDNRALLARYGALCTRLMGIWQEHAALPPSGARGKGPVRVAVVSAHFRHHSVWNAPVKGWFRQLDPRRVALYAFDLGSIEDAQTAFAKSRAAHYERGPKELRDWAAAILACRPDVIIYPELGMDAMTARLAALRLAPLQAASWGHPETSGFATVDYYLSAEDFEPAGAQAHYTEQLVTLPGLGCRIEYQEIAPSDPDLQRAGVDPQLPVLLCPGMAFKYAPQHDWVLAEIARRVGPCRFVFFAHWNPALTAQLAERLKTAFAARDLNYESFVSFIPWQTPAGFHGWLRRADVYLDTIGFSGFNTALHAVECGIPIVTREGRFLRGRLASGILKRLGLQELVAATEQAYVDLAVRLIEDADYSEAIAARIATSRSALYEDPAPVQALEEFLVSA
jgi:predicted O-linked N-acetylglucosamine transferase (SPINDLY family)